MKPDTPNKIKNAILQKIRSGELSMHSSGYFALRLAALVAVSILALLVSVLIFNFIFFALRVSGQSALLGFGSRGIFFFVQIFPWHLVALDALLLIVAERLLRRFPFGYKSPVIVLFIALCALAISTGLFIDRATDINDRLMDRADHHGFPAFFNDAFQHARRPVQAAGVCRCTIISIVGTAIVVQEDEAEGTSTLTVVLPLDGGESATTTGLKAGDKVFIVGDEIGGIIQAYGIRKINERHRSW